MIQEGTISPEDKELFLYTDDIQEALDFINENAVKKFNLNKFKRPKRKKWLGE